MTTQAETQRVTRKTWTIMLAGLCATLFQKTNHHAHLTQWVDLQEEIQEI